MPRARTWHSLHTQLNADSVEFMPVWSHEDVAMNQANTCTRTFVCGNYQLNETTREKTGRIYLYQLEKADAAANDDQGAAAASVAASASSAAAAAPAAAASSVAALSAVAGAAPARLVQQQVLDTAAIFDLKWCPRLLGGKQLLGQADASGALLLYEWKRGTGSTGAPASPSSFPSSSLSLLHSTQVDEKASCLSLDWSNRVTAVAEPLVAVSHSNSKLSVWQLASSAAEFVEQRRWTAHEYEVWIAHFDAHSSGNVLYSGADDCTFRGWDLRLPTPGQRSAVFSDSSTHGMGVCSIASHPSPSRAHVVATGSYDESVRLWDMRQSRKPILIQEHALGGGVWRVRWNNGDDDGNELEHSTKENSETGSRSRRKADTLLCCAMHNGFAVLDVDFEFAVAAAADPSSAASAADAAADELPSRLSAASISAADSPSTAAAAAESASSSACPPAFPSAVRISTVATYKAHTSLAYGADWCSQPRSWASDSNNNCASTAEFKNSACGLANEVIATCSFYDKQLDVWSIDMEAVADAAEPASSAAAVVAAASTTNAN
jgi:diphthamide biosynthesis protein 7